jgi:hypothetical protein
MKDGASIYIDCEDNSISGDSEYKELEIFLTDHISKAWFVAEEKFLQKFALTGTGSKKSHVKNKIRPQYPALIWVNHR